MKAKTIFSALSVFGVAAVAVCLTVFNMSKSGQSSAASNLSLSNVKTVQATAAEMICDATNSKTCTITSASGVVATATGNGIYIP
jgi:hypothetical protein